MTLSQREPNATGVSLPHCLIFVVSRSHTVSLSHCLALTLSRSHCNYLALTVSRSGTGPAWTRGGIEPPSGVKDMGGWSARVYSAEQMERLGVDEDGKQPASINSTNSTQ